MQWLMLHKKRPDDYVISTGKSSSVKDFINKVTTYLGIKIKWVGKGLKEHAVVIDIKNISNISESPFPYSWRIQIYFFKSFALC